MNNTKESVVNNILVSDFDTLHNTPPFSKIDESLYLPAFYNALELARAEIKLIEDDKSEATFSNTIEALEKSGAKLEQVGEIFFNLNHAQTSDKMQAIAEEISPVLTEFSNDINMNEALFFKVQYVYDRKKELNLNKEENKLLENSYKGFVKSGALLSEDKKSEMRSISTKLSKLGLKFSNNVLAATNNFFLHIKEESKLSGLPDGLIEAAVADAKQKNLEGWVFTLQFPSYVPFMTYADDRSLRKQMFEAYSTRCISGEYSNIDIIAEIVVLRNEKAKLFNYDSYASYALENRMAKKAITVDSFLSELLEASMPKAKQEYVQLQEFASGLGADSILQKWDWGYYAEKLKTKLFDVNDEITRPYFELEKITKGIFDLATDLYGLSFVKNDKIDVYHKDVTAYDVYEENGDFLSVFYTDFFPRQTKQGGAWMTSFREQYISNGKDNRPLVSIVCNFTKPTLSTPSLLSFNEVTTFLHEFGHALHGMLSKCTYASISGTNVFRDFVELPSQFMENYAFEKQWLDKVAVHYKTGEAMPSEIIDNIIASGNFHEAYSFVRQLSFGILDMKWHSTNKTNIDVMAFEKKAMESTDLFPDVEGICASTSFSHIFAGGYAAGYYGYKWAEVLDADAFAAFKEKGVFNKEIARKFRQEILEKGGSEDADVLYRNFRGHDAGIDALLLRSGLK